jgi:hypothetical protein
VPQGQRLRAARPQRRWQVDPDQHPGRAGERRPAGRRASGASISTRTPAQRQASIGIVPQELVFDPFFTPFETLENQAGLLWRAQGRGSMELLRAVHLEDKADAYARTLSGGMKRRLLVAKAMVHSPPVLVLDEPTAGVDIELRQQLWELCPRTQRRRRDRRADHALSRRGRGTVRPHRHHQPRQADRQQADPRTGRHGAGKDRGADRRQRRMDRKCRRSPA